MKEKKKKIKVFHNRMKIFVLDLLFDFNLSFFHYQAFHLDAFSFTIYVDSVHKFCLPLLDVVLDV